MGSRRSRSTHYCDPRARMSEYELVQALGSNRLEVIKDDAGRSDILHLKIGLIGDPVPKSEVVPIELQLRSPTDAIHKLSLEVSIPGSVDDVVAADAVGR